MELPSCLLICYHCPCTLTHSLKTSQMMAALLRCCTKVRIGLKIKTNLQKLNSIVYEEAKLLLFSLCILFLQEYSQ